MKNPCNWEESIFVSIDWQIDSVNIHAFDKQCCYLHTTKPITKQSLKYHNNLSSDWSKLTQLLSSRAEFSNNSGFLYFAIPTLHPSPLSHTLAWFIQLVATMSLFLIFCGVTDECILWWPIVLNNKCHSFIISRPVKAPTKSYLLSEDLQANAMNSAVIMASFFELRRLFTSQWLHIKSPCGDTI